MSSLLQSWTTPGTSCDMIHRFRQLDHIPSICFILKGVTEWVKQISRVKWPHEKLQWNLGVAHKCSWAVCCRCGDHIQHIAHAFRSSQPSPVMYKSNKWFCLYVARPGGTVSSEPDLLVVNRILTVTLGSLHWSIHWCPAECFQIRAKRSCLFAANTRIKSTLIFMYFVCTLARGHGYTWGVDKTYCLHLLWRCKGPQS